MTSNNNTSLLLMSGYDKKSKINHDGQDRKFVCILYPDSTEYNYEEVLANICMYASEWSYILHDRDVESVVVDGEEKQVKKKPHYHVCMLFETPRIRLTVANNIGIEKNYIMRCKRWKGANRYLIHLDDDDKYPYMVHDVSANFDFRILTGTRGTELEKVDELIDFIVNEKCTSVRKLADYARQQKLWDAFRRNYTILKDYMYEIREEQLQAQARLKDIKMRNQLALRMESTKHEED